MFLNNFVLFTDLKADGWPGEIRFLSTKKGLPSPVEAADLGKTTASQRFPNKKRPRKWLNLHQSSWEMGNSAL